MKTYTVIIVSFDRCSYFIVYITANTSFEALKLACEHGDAETGIEYEGIACFEGMQMNLTSDKVFDWR